MFPLNDLLSIVNPALAQELNEEFICKGPIGYHPDRGRHSHGPKGMGLFDRDGTRSDIDAFGRPNTHLHLRINDLSPLRTSEKARRSPLRL